MNKTFEQALRDNAIERLTGSQFVVSVIAVYDDHLDISVRPESKDGETLDFALKGNDITPYEQ